MATKAHVVGILPSKCCVAIPSNDSIQFLSFFLFRKVGVEVEFPIN
jgi:hypothetical protein